MNQGGPGPAARPSIAVSSRWILIGTLLSKPVQLATNVLLARILGPAGFGLLGLANTTGLAFSGIASLGLNDAAGKFIAEHFRRDPKTSAAISRVIFSTLFVVGAAFFLLAWLLRDAWGQRIFAEAVSDNVIALCLGLGFVNVLFAFANSALTGLQDFRAVTLLTLLQAILLLCLGGTLGYAYGTSGAQWAYLLAAFLCVAWACRKLQSIDRQMLRAPEKADFRRLGKLLHFGAPSWVAAFFVHPLNLLALAYLAHQSGGQHEIGLFNSANGIKMLVAVIPGIVGSAIGPAIFQEAGTHGDPVAFRKLLRDAFAALGFLTVPLTICMLFLSEPLFLLYGTAYAGSHLLFLPLATGIAIALMGSTYQFALTALNRTWWLLGLIALKLAVLLSLAWWWIPAHNASGLAWATGIADVFYTVLLVEVAVRSGAIPRGGSQPFYKYAIGLIAILGVAWFVPSHLLWALAVPLALGTGIVMARVRPALADWIFSATPEPLRPPVGRLLALITRGTVR